MHTRFHLTSCHGLTLTSPCHDGSDVFTQGPWRKFGVISFFFFFEFHTPNGWLNYFAEVRPNYFRAVGGGSVPHGHSLIDA